MTDPTIEDRIKSVADTALGMFPNANGDPLKAVCLRVMQLERYEAERIEALNLNAQLAMRIAHLEARIKR